MGAKFGLPKYSNVSYHKFKHKSQPSKGMIVLVFSPILEEMLENAAVFVWRLPFDPAPFLEVLEDLWSESPYIKRLQPPQQSES